MKQVKTYSELFKELEKLIKPNIQKIGEEVKNVLKRFIQTDLYDSYEPKEYERTFQFLEAVECTAAKKVGNKWQVKIFINPDKMDHFSADDDRFWLPHTSSIGDERGNTSFGSKDIAEWLIYWLETGDNTSPYSRGEIGMFKKTKEWLEDDNYVYNTMMSRLRQAGFEIEGSYK